MNLNFRKLLFLPLLIAIILNITSCTIPLDIQLYNNSLKTIVVQIGDNRIKIKHSNIGIIEAIEFKAFSIHTNETSNSYQFPRTLLSSTWHWEGWGPFKQRVTNAQLEHDGNIWLITKKGKLPVTNFIEQPDGFPIKPDT